MPRIVSAPVAGETFSKYAKQVGADLGMPPDEDQCAILDAIYRVDGDGSPACFEVAIIAPRQNIKTSTLEIAALTDLFVFGEKLHIWTAQLYDTAQKTFRHMRDMIASNAEYRDLCRWPPREAHGDEAIELLSGEAIEFYARSKKAARGFTKVPKITFDEALFLEAGHVGSTLPTMAVYPDAQVRYGSSAGMADSEVLREVRDRGYLQAPDLAYFEWCAPRVDCLIPQCGHQVGIEGCQLDNRALWAEANPALGRRISEKRLGQFRNAMPPAEFAREFLGWWDEDPSSGRAIPADEWKAAADPHSEAVRAAVFGIGVADDRSWAAVGVAGASVDGWCHVEVGAYRQTTAWVVDFLAEMRARQKVKVVLRPGSEAGSLVTDLERARIDVVKASQSDYAAACGDFRDSVVSKRNLRHLGQRELNVAVAGAQSRRIGDSTVWDQRNPNVDICPLEAVTLAAWGHRSVKARPGRFVAF